MLELECIFSSAKHLNEDIEHLVVLLANEIKVLEANNPDFNADKFMAHMFDLILDSFKLQDLVQVEKDELDNKVTDLVHTQKTLHAR